MTQVLDEQAKDILRRLRPGDTFTLRDDPRGVFFCKEIVHPVKGEPYVKSYRVWKSGRDGVITGGYHSPGISRVGKILPKE